MRANDAQVASSPHPVWWREDPLTPLRRSVPEWRSIVMEAYDEQPTLSVTLAQGQRLWGLDASTCGYVLDGLVESGLLVRSGTGQYCRADYLRPDEEGFVL